MRVAGGSRGPPWTEYVRTQRIHRVVSDKFMILFTALGLTSSTAMNTSVARPSAAAPMS
jgi:hypothetical protein